MGTGETNYDTIFGKIALDQGLCTNDELRVGIEKLKERRKSTPAMLRDLMVELGYITDNQAERLRNSIKETRAAVHQIPGYKILGKLGAGAMAIVYKARQLSLDREVAIKVLQAAAKFNHNNIVQAYDVGEAGGYHYFVMEYVEGKTIYDDIAAGQVFPEDEALDMVIQVARALEHAHNRGLIHRDVKPKNIIINPSGVVKLADMGLARETTDIETAQTEEGKAYGTPYYIAPEQIRGKIDIDGRADIYGLGATFYHMVTGRVPFMADDPTEVMKKHLKEPIIPPDHINTSLSAGLSEIIEVMMAKRREERYKDVEELLVDLEAVRSGLPPLRAHKRFDFSMLEQLEEGETIEVEDNSYKEEAVARYKTAIVILSIMAVLLTLIIFLLILRNTG
ncbi:MAG: serine/threonine protein kinase [Planctomycetota bacterium]|jgi:serine/threonine-protein kinase